MSSAVDATVKGFRKQQRESSHALLNPIVFALALSEQGSAITNSAGSVLEFLLVPLFGTLSDRQTRKTLLLTTLVLAAAARGGDWFRKASGFQTMFLAALAQGCVGGFLATAKASVQDHCDEPLKMAQSGIQLASAGTLGALLNPLFSGIARRLFGGKESSPELMSALVALLGAIAILVQAEAPSPEVDRYAEDSIISYTPMSIARLMSSSPEAPKAIAASFLSQIAGGVAVREFVEQTVRSSTPLATVRLRLLLSISFASLAGIGVSAKIQQTLGLHDQASIAGAANAATALALALNRPYVAAFFLLFGQRGSDVTDIFIVENRNEGGGRGETAASMSNVHALAGTLGAIGLGFVNSQTGVQGVAGALIACAAASEYLRRRLRTKLMYPDQ